MAQTKTTYNTFAEAIAVIASPLNGPVTITEIVIHIDESETIKYIVEA